jgi:hypothetical protein
MKILVVLCLAFLTFAMSTQTDLANSVSQYRDSKTDIQDSFVGAWRLVSLEVSGPDGKIHTSDSTGLLVFSRDGHMSVQVMERNPQPQSTAGPEQYSLGGYEASFGTYAVDESSHIFTFHVDGALVRTLIGKDLPRAFVLSGQQLTVKPARPDEHWKVVWEHY